jgi:hypothetical protein
VPGSAGSSSRPGPGGPARRAARSGGLSLVREARFHRPASCPRWRAQVLVPCASVARTPAPYGSPAPALAWWARIEAMSPPANRPAAVVCPSARSVTAMPCNAATWTASAILARTRAPPAAAASVSQGGRRGRSAGTGPRHQSAAAACGAARRAERAESGCRRPAGCPPWSAGGGPPRRSRPAGRG